MVIQTLTKGQKISAKLKGKPAKWISSDKYLEICKKISDNKRGKPNKGGLKNRGKKRTPEQIEAMRKYKLEHPTRYWLGKKRPDIAIKMSLASKGRKISEERRKQIGDFFRGKKHTLETRIKMSIARKGEKSSLWKGGKSKEYKRIRASTEFRIWRELVFKRDNWTCTKCKEKGGKLIPHHIEGFTKNKDKRFIVSNGVTLCEKDHKLFHKKYGFDNFTKYDLFRFLQENEQYSDYPEWQTLTEEQIVDKMKSEYPEIYKKFVLATI